MGNRIYYLAGSIVATVASIYALTKYPGSVAQFTAGAFLGAGIFGIKNAVEQKKNLDFNRDRFIVNVIVGAATSITTAVVSAVGQYLIKWFGLEGKSKRYVEIGIYVIAGAINNVISTCANALLEKRKCSPQELILSLIDGAIVGGFFTLINTLCDSVSSILTKDYNLTSKTAQLVIGMIEGGFAGAAVSSVTTAIKNYFVSQNISKGVLEAALTGFVYGSVMGAVKATKKYEQQQLKNQQLNQNANQDQKQDQIQVTPDNNEITDTNNKQVFKVTPLEDTQNIQAQEPTHNIENMKNYQPIQCECSKDQSISITNTQENDIFMNIDIEKKQVEISLCRTNVSLQNDKTSLIQNTKWNALHNQIQEPPRAEFLQTLLPVQLKILFAVRKYFPSEDQLKTILKILI